MCDAVADQLVGAAWECAFETRPRLLLSGDLEGVLCSNCSSSSMLCCTAVCISELPRQENKLYCP